jgi:hypothetical protein
MAPNKISQENSIIPWSFFSKPLPLIDKEIEWREELHQLPPKSISYQRSLECWKRFNLRSNYQKGGQR